MLKGGTLDEIRRTVTEIFDKNTYLCSKQKTCMGKQELKKLTNAEANVMNVLWDAQTGLSTQQAIDQMPEPHPAYSTVATTLKVLEAKGYVEHHRQGGTGRTFIYTPLITREAYLTHVIRDVKDRFFGKSVTKLFSFLVRDEKLSADEVREILKLIEK